MEDVATNQNLDSLSVAPAAAASTPTPQPPAPVPDPTPPVVTPPVPQPPVSPPAPTPTPTPPVVTPPAPTPPAPAPDPVPPTPTPPQNRAPTITGTPATQITVGSAYSFIPSAADADRDRLTFAIVNKPSWASFNTASGALTGTPAAADVAVTRGIVIAVSDGKASKSLPAFDLTVNAASSPAPANRPPTISGTPATQVTQGSAYNFVASAADADGDTLTFSIVNKPAWATFSTSSGALTGTPGASNVGITRGIVISVTDGTDRVSLPAFDLTVNAQPARNVTVSWVTPTVNADGTPLSDLAGFYVRYGTASLSYSSSIRIDDPSVGNYVVQGLNAGQTYYFTVAAFDTAGNTGANGAEASKLVQ